MKNFVEEIIREKSIKNEKSLAYTRILLFIAPASLDLISYFTESSFTKIKPDLITILIDLLFLLSPLNTLFLIKKNFYNQFFKFGTITIDYAFIAFTLLFDPTIPKTGEGFIWSSLLACIFLFYMNLLKYSRSTTIYSGILSLSLFFIISFNLKPSNEIDIAPMILGLSTLIFLGYSITNSNLKMMEEANTKILMERYLSPQLVNELYKKNTNLEPGGKNQTVTILFSDIRSFTSISEKISPEEVVEFLNKYLSEMTEVIYSQNGTIDKFIGDAILTIFGAPIQNIDDPIRAIRTAIQMNYSLKKLNRGDQFFSEPIKMGIGIHTGKVIAGNIGSSKRLDYTVIGDNVNLCSRIESLTKIYPCSILISETTYSEISKLSVEDFLVREVDEVIVKGKSQSIKLYEILDFSNIEEKDEKLNLILEFENALKLYRNKNFSSAKLEFLKLKNDPLSIFYLTRISDLEKNIPDNWDGIYRFDTK